MALVTNLVVTLVCALGYFKARPLGLSYWRDFFLFFGIASLFGGLSHVFWNYWGFYGKIIPWLFGTLGSAFLAFAIFDLFNWTQSIKKSFAFFLIFKATLVLYAAISKWDFVYVALDSISTLFIVCGVGSFIFYFRNNNPRLVLMPMGFLVMLPAAFVFLFKIDLHKFLNREDLSHLLIASGLLFYIKSLSRIVQHQLGFSEPRTF